MKKFILSFVFIIHFSSTYSINPNQTTNTKKDNKSNTTISKKIIASLTTLSALTLSYSLHNKKTKKEHEISNFWRNQFLGTWQFFNIYRLFKASSVTVEQISLESELIDNKKNSGNYHSLQYTLELRPNYKHQYEFPNIQVTYNTIIANESKQVLSSIFNNNEEYFITSHFNNNESYNIKNLLPLHLYQARCILPNLSTQHECIFEDSKACLTSSIFIKERCADSQSRCITVEDFSRFYMRESKKIHPFFTADTNTAEAANADYTSYLNDIDILPLLNNKH